MTPERWQQITYIFENALLQAPGDRSAFLEESCKGDPKLRQEIDALLAAHDQAGTFIDGSALSAAAKQDGGSPSQLDQTIAHYKVMSLLGSGGMGDVYLAEDTRLGRKVALKILPEYFAGDEKRARLFAKEARAASALNHPNIITVYEIGQFEGRFYLAMEYVDGHTLRELICAGQTPLAKLLNYLQQVAEGLTKAHAAGIVHRDLKPDNIMVSRDGFAKVLDFGLAKLLQQPNSGGNGEPDSSEAKTAIMSQTSMPGVVMGTLGYMSPEQALGRVTEIDHRSDIFTFGCILFEAATGQQAFDGENLLDSLHKIVHSPTPQIREIDPDIPESLDRVARRCLAKDPEKRYHSIKDVAIELEDIQHELADHPAAAGARGSRPKRRATGEARTHTAVLSAPSTAEFLLSGIRRHKLGIFVALAGVIAVIAAGGFLLYRSGTFGVRPPAAKPLSAFQEKKFTRLTTSGRTIDASISPDGKYLAYLDLEVPGGTPYGAAQASIWIRLLASSRDIKIVEAGEFILRGMVFSPDSNFLFYRVQSKNISPRLFRISVLGGEPQKVLDGAFSPPGFSPNGKQMAFVRNHNPEAGKSNIVVANADGTGERILSSRGPGIFFAAPARPAAPAWSPDAKFILCSAGYVNGGFSLLALPVDGGPDRSIGQSRWSYVDSFVWLAGGESFLMVGRNADSGQSQIWQIGYPSGEARRVTNDMSEYRGISLTADQNSAVLVQGSREADLWLAPGNGSGEARAVTSGREKNDGLWGMSWTPDGRLVYVSNASGNRDLWFLDPAKGIPQQLTSNQGQNFYPLVTPDGRQIFFFSDRGGQQGIWRMDIDGRNPAFFKAGLLLGPARISPDGRWIIYPAMGNRGVATLYKMSVDGGEPVPLHDQYWQEHPAISPDGKQIALQYFVMLSGNVTLGRMPFEGGEITKIVEPPFRIGTPMHWTPDGTGLAYIDNRDGAGNIWVIPIDGGPPRQLTNFRSDSIFWFAWSPDGKQLALSRGTQITDAVRIDDVK